MFCSVYKLQRFVNVTLKDKICQKKRLGNFFRVIFFSPKDVSTLISSSKKSIGGFCDNRVPNFNEKITLIRNHKLADSYRTRSNSQVQRRQVRVQVWVFDIESKSDVFKSKSYRQVRTRVRVQTRVLQHWCKPSVRNYNST